MPQPSIASLCLLLAATLPLGCGDATPADSTSSENPARSAAGPSSDPIAEKAAQLKSDEWWTRAEAALARLEVPEALAWNHAYFALCLEGLEREDEAEQRLLRVDDATIHAFAIERLALYAWRKQQTARFERLLVELSELVAQLPDDSTRRYHHGLLYVFQVAAEQLPAAEASWFISRGDPAPSDELHNELLNAQLSIQAALGRETDWRATWNERYELPPEINDLALLLRGMLFVGNSDRVGTLLEASLAGALGDAGARRKDGLFPAQRLVADWARDGFADETLPVWERLQISSAWPDEPAPPAELGQALARAARPTEALALAENMSRTEAERVYEAVAVAYENVGASSAADALIERVDLIESSGLLARRLIARAEYEATAEARDAAVDHLLKVGDDLPASELDLLGKLVSMLHEQGAKQQLERVSDRYSPGFRQAEALPSLAALTVGLGLDDRLFRMVEKVFQNAPQPSARVFALAALAARNGHQAEMPPMDLGLRVDQVIAGLSFGLQEQAKR